MIVNSTCVSGNGTTTCLPQVSPPLVGLAVLVPLLLAAGVVAVCIYYRREIRNKLQRGHGRSRGKEARAKTPEADSNQYTSTRRQQSRPLTPIYENLTTQTQNNRRSMTKQCSWPGGPEEDLYLQCDSTKEAIYSNDPACTLSILPPPHDEDVYIMPDS